MQFNKTVYNEEKKKKAFILLLKYLIIYNHNLYDEK